MNGSPSVQWFTTAVDVPVRAVERYKCPTCHKRFERTIPSTFSCCVQHGPGDCCHAFEVEVHKKGWTKRVQR